MKKLIVSVFLLIFVCSGIASAQDVWQLAESEVYGEKALGMLGRGLLNVVTSPIDIPVQTVAGTQRQKPEFIGAVGGFATGAACTVLRAASGIIDVATFWAPGFNGVPVSRSYENCLDASHRSVRAPVPSYTQPTPYTPPAKPYAPPAEPQVVKQSTPAPKAYEPPAPKKDDPMKYVKK
jgi:putative exosortase-associated protein (TIGR04073 family)